MSKSRRGFGSMTPEERKKIASMGGKALAEKGHDYMAQIGRVAGIASGKARKKKINPSSEESAK